MKRLILWVWLATVLGAVGQSNMISASYATGSFYASATNVYAPDNFILYNTRGYDCYKLVIGENVVTISTTNGAVKIKDGVTLDEASREFWKAVERAYPYMFKEARK